MNAKIRPRPVPQEPHPYGPEVSDFVSYAFIVLLLALILFGVITWVLWGQT